MNPHIISVGGPAQVLWDSSMCISGVLEIPRGMHPEFSQYIHIDSYFADNFPRKAPHQVSRPNLQRGLDSHVDASFDRVTSPVPV